MVVSFGVSNTSFATEEVTKNEDVCSNIEGVQSEVPGGYHGSNGECLVYNENGMPSFFTETVVVEPVDVCPNIDGTQEVVPVGYALVDNTNCMPDVCSNLDGAQAKIPNNYYLGDGQCLLNLDIRFSTKDGITLSTPRENGKYVYDACPNMWGIQGGVPAGYTKDLLTNKCNKKPAVDLCNNIPGNQATLPKNHARKEDGSCYNKLTVEKKVKSVNESKKE